MKTEITAMWYVRKGTRIQGPFSQDDMQRYVLLGRIRHTDRVSIDRNLKLVLWEPVTQVPELIPDELLNLQSDDGWNSFMDAAGNMRVVTAVKAGADPEKRESSEWIRGVVAGALLMFILMTLMS